MELLDHTQAHARSCREVSMCVSGIPEVLSASKSYLLYFASYFSVYFRRLVYV